MNEDFWQYFAESFIKTETCIRVSTKRHKGEKRDFHSGKTFLNYSEHNFSLRGIFLWFFLQRPKHWFISVVDNQSTNEKEFNWSSLLKVMVKWVGFKWSRVVDSAFFGNNHQVVIRECKVKLVRFSKHLLAIYVRLLRYSEFGKILIEQKPFLSLKILEASRWSQGSKLYNSANRRNHKVRCFQPS